MKPYAAWCVGSFSLVCGLIQPAMKPHTACHVGSFSLMCRLIQPAMEAPAA
ncbi:MAG: hypothetical protein J6I36_05055 [Bacteroidaceae bacterium]|nr:hypothetical protein [Bacteroidaceae bacterium]MBQ9190288.1 hypothetical protein [Bacteroidaceae bacterium]MBR0244784.1 hypothetical protein [Bacteroidaceae bacterium]